MHASWQRQCDESGAECRLWTDDAARDFIASKYEWFLATYDGYRHKIQRVDALRYFLLYEYGGIYSDLDIGIRTSLATLRQFKGVTLPVTKPMGFSNDLMIATPKHPFLLQVIHALVDFDVNYGLPYLTVMASTGPLFLSIQAVLFHNRSAVNALSPHLYGSRTGLVMHTDGNSWHSWDAEMILMAWQYSMLTMCLLVLCCTASTFCCCKLWQWSAPAPGSSHKASKLV